MLVVVEREEFFPCDLGIKEAFYFSHGGSREDFQKFFMTLDWMIVCRMQQNASY